MGEMKGIEIENNKFELCIYFLLKLTVIEFVSNDLTPVIRLVNLILRTQLNSISMDSTLDGNKSSPTRVS